MSNYSRGRDAEWKVRDHLRGEGYIVLRTAGSKGAIDLLAVKPGQVLCVQVKAKAPLPPAQWNNLFTLARHMNAVPVLADVLPHRPIRYTRLLAPTVPRGRRACEPFLTDATFLGE